MLNPWLSFSLKVWQICLEAQCVIALRVLRLAAGGARAEAEASRMATEKILAAGQAQAAAATATMRGHKKHVVAGKALNIYGKRVRANRRRLRGEFTLVEALSLGARPCRETYRRATRCPVECRRKVAHDGCGGRTVSRMRSCTARRSGASRGRQTARGFLL